MKKKLIAMVVSAAAVIPAAAMADVDVYGRVHVSTDFLDDGADYSEVNISSNSSRLGFKGNHQINPDLKAFFQIEQEINFTNSNGDNFSTRDTFVGLSGNFGAVQLGRFDSPFKVARGPANLFGDQVGDMRNLTRAGQARFDERYDNTFQYTTPNFSGFNAKLAYSVHEDSVAASDHKTDSVSLSLNYAGGPFEASLAYEQVSEEATRGERDGIRLAAAYKLTSAAKLVGFYQTLDYTGLAGTSDAVQEQNTSDVYGLGAELKVTANTAIKAMWMARAVDADDRDSDMLAVGVEHKLDKAVRVYANYALVNNDDNIALTPWGQARTATPPGTNGETASALSVGLRYDF